MSRLVIGVHGRANHGKNTVAGFLGGRFTEISFAEPMYAALAAITGIPAERLRDRQSKEQVIPWLGKSPRQMLQSLGTEWGRGMVSDQIWIDVAARRIEACDGDVAVTDVRFDNEAQMLKDRFGAVVWEVVRPGATTCESHSSERGVSRRFIDRTIVNDGDLAALEMAVGMALNATLKEYPRG